MYKIGEFSILSKTTIKTLRYYEKEKLLIPSYVDKITGYRFYETNQLPELSKIIALRQIGMSISDIKKMLDGKSREILQKRKKEIEEEIIIANSQLLRINYLLEEENMKYEAIIKELPDHIVYYKEGIVKSLSEIPEFILSSADECISTNPNIKCIEPGYCYVSYLDEEYKEENISILYAQAVDKMGVENEKIKFKKLKTTEAVCVYHKGSYENIRQAYSFVLKWIEENGYKISEPPRETYIDGVWNKNNEEDFLTEIQVPVIRNK